ncbi:C-X-C motif chemokine 2-like [Crotalus tigris]|uniref:C-X-C motif chemokine 2-like n=1 Tax=Crotalus tigris TaxID=88082 RepID=UPI00192F5AC3|nr:C-X-C motif chemokine 2-like [Crotalus tigris]
MKHYVVGQRNVNGWTYSESTFPCLATYKSIKSLQRALQSILQPPRRKMDRQLFSASFLLLFLLIVLVPSTGNTLPIENNGCQCNPTTLPISPRSINSVHLIQSGQHCSVLQVIATIKNGTKVCLNPELLWVKRIVQVLLNRENN